MGPRRPDGPFLRPEPAPAPATPEGWVAAPFGRWQGRDTVVVYDPRRFDVLVMRSRARHDVLDGLTAAGWRPAACDGRSWLWFRDRLAAARARLDHVGAAAGRPLDRSNGRGFDR
jgi:hypothetical protein